MARRLGPYAPLSATYATDDAIIEAEEKAELLYVRGLAFCAASESDGFITRAQLRRFVGAGMDDVMDRAARLVEVGLWEEEGGGFVVRAWLKWNASTEELGRARRKDRERKAAAKRSESFRPEGVEDSVTDSGKDEETEGGPESEERSERNPSGIQTEEGSESGEESADHSDGSPDGFQPRAGARVEARAPDSLHSTTHNNTPPSPQGGERRKRRVGAEDYDSDPDFVRFWDVFPVKQGKVAGFKAWQQAVARGDNPELIIQAAEWFRDDPSRNPEKTKWAQGWLNERRYKEQQPIQRRQAYNDFWNN